MPSSKLNIQKALTLKLCLIYQHLTLFCRGHPPPPGPCLSDRLDTTSNSTTTVLTAFTSTFAKHSTTSLFSSSSTRCVGSLLNKNYERTEAKNHCFLRSPNPFIHSTLSVDYVKHSPTETSKKYVHNKYLLMVTEHLQK